MIIIVEVVTLLWPYLGPQKFQRSGRCQATGPLSDPKTVTRAVTPFLPPTALPPPLPPPPATHWPSGQAWGAVQPECSPKPWVPPGLPGPEGRLSPSLSHRTNGDTPRLLCTLRRFWKRGERGKPRGSRTDFGGKDWMPLSLSLENRF